MAVNLAQQQTRSHIGGFRIRGRYNVPDDTCLVSQVYTRSRTVALLYVRLTTPALSHRYIHAAAL